ncbi:hypothetical protein PTKIN_Ptkin05aG0218600 [Pterospermum kingtungense]
MHYTTPLPHALHFSRNVASSDVATVVQNQIGSRHYEMERDYAGWFVKYRVDLDAITVAFPDMIIRYFGRDCYKYATFCVVEEANEEDSYMVLHIPGKVIQYNLKDGSFQMIYELDPENNDHHEGFHLYRSPLKYFVAYQYIPSLSSV